MNTATIERPIERASEVISGQTQRAVMTSTRPYWPLPATQLPDAHFTWPEWVARLAERIASERISQRELSAA